MREEYEPAKHECRDAPIAVDEERVATKRHRLLEIPMDDGTRSDAREPRFEPRIMG
jgi:hypothetical protein